jgi:hypothetical protein
MYVFMLSEIWPFLIFIGSSVLLSFFLFFSHDITPLSFSNIRCYG